MNSAVSSAFLESDCVGRTIDGRFTLLRWLGGTERSSVFFTHRDGDPAQKAAIKLISANTLDAENRVAQWEKAKTLSHPHLMRIFDAGRCAVDGVDLLYVVTDYADEVLSEILRERALTPGEAGEMMGPVLDALTWLHSRKLVHGHLKPSNIMVVNDQLKLSADRLHSWGEPGTASAWSGRYDAPEAALVARAATADVWSLGVVLVEALTQRPPVWDRFGGGEPVMPVPIRQPFFNVARECLRVDPASRATLAGIRETLNTVPAAEATGRMPEAQRGKSWLARPQISKTQGMIAGGVVVAAGIIATLFVGFHHPTSGPAAVQNSAPTAPASSAVQPAHGSSPAPRAQHPVPGAQHTAPRAQASAAPQENRSSAPPARTPAPAPAPAPAPQAQAAAPQAEAQSGDAVVKGSVASQVTPDVPQHIRDTITGHIQVRVAVQVDSAGNVADATLDTPGPSKYFANQALTAARQWKFKPAAAGGHAVASQWFLLFRFGQEETTVAPTETAP